MTDRRAEILEHLLELPDPYHNRSEEWLDYLSLGLTEADLPELIALMSDPSFHEAYGDEQEVWVPLHCWRTLGQLRTVAALGPILALRDKLPDDDWLSSDLAEIAILIGPEALPLLAVYLADEGKDEYNLVDVAEAINQLGQSDPSIKDECVRLLCGQLERFERNTPLLNGMLVSDLLDLKALDSFDTIRRAYVADAVDISICGDLEDVEIELGLRSERSTPPPKIKLFPGLEFEDEEEEPHLPPAQHVQRPAQHPIQRGKKTGRNDPCPCGSGKKYKKCCLG